MSIRLLFPTIALSALVATSAAMGQTSPSEAAKAFTLDGLAPAPTPSATPVAAPSATPAAGASDVDSAAPPILAAPAVPDSAAVATAAVATPPPTAAIRAVFTLDTPIQDLIADPGAKAVLDKDLPGMSDDQNLDKFKMLSLRSLQPQTGGQLTDAMLAKVASDLDVLGGGSGAVTAPVRAGNSKRNQDGSR